MWHCPCVEHHVAVLECNFKCKSRKGEHMTTFSVLCKSLEVLAGFSHTIVLEPSLGVFAIVGRSADHFIALVH